MMITNRTTAAVLLLISLTGVLQQQASSATVTFQVRDFWTADPIPTAVVLLSGPTALNQTTNQAGNTTFTIPFGSYMITVSKTQCSQIGPQSFIVDQTAPAFIIAKLQCPPAGSPPLANPHVQTDRTQYQIGEVIEWTATGFAPGAYIQPCLGEMCGAVVQSSNSGIYQGIMVVDGRVSAGNQTLSITDITTNAQAQSQILILT